MAEVTIIIPSYNHQDYIEQRLDSILQQTYSDWEAIIIDDMSIDNSVDIIENYLKQHPEFKVKHFIKNDINSGSGYKSWQKGIALAETEFIWIAETDDYSDISFLETTVSVLKANVDSALVFTASNYVNEKGEFLYDTSKRFTKLKLDKGQTKIFKCEIITNYLPLNPLITNGSSVVFRKPNSLIPELIFSHKQLSDLFLWTYLLKGKTFGCINSALNNFRRHNASTTTINATTSGEKIYEEYSNYLDYFNLGYSKSVEVLDHYIGHFLIPHRKEKGYFYIKPIAGITAISDVQKRYRIIRTYLKHILKKVQF